MTLTKEWYDLREVNTLTGYNIDTLRRKIKSGAINNYKEEQSKYFIFKDDVLLLKKQREKTVGVYSQNFSVNEKDWYTITEFCHITKFSRNMVINHIKQGKIKNTNQIGKKYLIHKCEVNIYLSLRKEREQKSKPIVADEDLNDYVTTNDFSLECGISSKKVTKLIREGKITKYMKGNKIYLIHKDEIATFNKLAIKRCDLNDNFMTITQVINSGRYSFLSEYRLSEYSNNGVFQGVEYFEGSCYIPISELEKFNDILKTTFTFSETLKILEIAKNDLYYFMNNGYVNYTKMNDYLLYLNKEDVLRLKEDLEKAPSLEEVVKELNINLSILRSFIITLLLKVIKIKNKKEILLESSINQIKEFQKEYYLVSELCEKYRLTTKVIKRLIKHKYIIADLIDNRYYRVNKLDSDTFFGTSEGVKICYYNTDAPIEYFKAMKEVHEKETAIVTNHKWYYQFASMRLKASKSNNIKYVISILIGCFEKILLGMEIKVQDLSDEQIKEIILNDDRIGNQDIELFCLFLKYLQTKVECNFNSDFSMMVKRERKQEIEIYNEEEWLLICQNVNDISNHISKSIENYRYSQAWLYILLHLNLAWRKSDFYQLVSPNIDLISIKSFTWFDNNELSLESSQKLINDFRLKNSFIKAQKNHIKVKIIVTLLQSTATALVICELHRKKLNIESPKIFNHRIDAFYLGKVLERVNVNFMSRKLNKSLLTYSFVSAVNSGDKSALAYDLQSNARSHKNYIDCSNEVTKVYLATTNTDGDYTVLSKHLFERGFFGWQLDMMLNLLFKGDQYSLNDKTIAIKELDSIMSPQLVEGVSQFVYTQYQQMEQLLQELLVMDKEEIIRRLELIAKEKSPSLIDHSQCFKGIDNCPNKFVKSCLGCKYLLPTNYLLEILRVRLEEIIEVLEQTSCTEKIKCIKYTHLLFQGVTLLQQFKVHFDKIDEGYIKSFIDLKSLKLKMIDLEQNNKIVFLKGNDKIG